MNAEPFYKFLTSNAKVPAFRIVRPFNWQKLFVTVASIVAIGTVTKLAWTQIHHVITNKNAWAVGCLVSLYTCIEVIIGYDPDVHFWTYVQCDSTYPVHLLRRAWWIQLHRRRISESVCSGNTDYGMYLYLPRPGFGSQ
jgi:hypothetical protein